MKKRLKEMEEEAAALRDMQAKVEKEMVAGAVQGMFVVRVPFWTCFRRLHEEIVKHWLPNFPKVSLKNGF